MRTVGFVVLAVIVFVAGSFVGQLQARSMSPAPGTVTIHFWKCVGDSVPAPGSSGNAPTCTNSSMLQVETLQMNPDGTGHLTRHKAGTPGSGHSGKHSVSNIFDLDCPAAGQYDCNLTEKTMRAKHFVRRGMGGSGGYPPNVTDNDGGAITQP